MSVFIQISTVINCFRFQSFFFAAAVVAVPLIWYSYCCFFIITDFILTFEVFLPLWSIFLLLLLLCSIEVQVSLRRSKITLVTFGCFIYWYIHFQMGCLFEFKKFFFDFIYLLFLFKFFLYLKFSKWKFSWPNFIVRFQKNSPVGRITSRKRDLIFCMC